ncbi:hypothetical protein PI124_g6321 [Phytophthora idaei]|nr:hypothetical protein PI125_g18664 [Phytophthora idaei]KAG3173176.1 hypothetical protein PI126_g974 [Phytophthora idaei]KAG3249007.1 hypothetical protein PI124_g6321 [Phytophthora idaei]
MGETTALETLKRFCTDVIDVCADEYLRYPSELDLT